MHCVLVSSGYVTEKMNTKSEKWDPQSHAVDSDTTEFCIPKLKEGDDYKFRVRAQNDRGLSDPLESANAVTVKNPFS